MKKAYILALYVPETHKEFLKNALFDAGAGKLGNYDRCCWETRGTGEFRPLPGAHPFLGTEMRSERVSEWKLEMIVAPECRAAVLAALRKNHPYETPAFHFLETELE